MKAMIFAAGRGERMAELTRDTPKPMLRAGGLPLIHYTVERLAAAGVREIVVNIAYLGEQIRRYLGDGDKFGVHIVFSEEPFPLETGGAILHALPLLGDAPFLVVNADVWCDYDFASLLNHSLRPAELGRLLMVPNPSHVPEGDFFLNEAGWLQSEPENPDQQRLTYSGISLLRPSLVSDYPQQRQVFPLGEAFRAAIRDGRLGGEIYRGQWRDIGTPERLTELQASL
ncbi:N-acetylmuramate alpha-1-phosphate uridylyltransferase MurU [Gilvimarinus sp. F26214L]|uniref:N-acetylmuramate alpha-1-phosphate uridylyltransferase MurU n=1 Tax=Gilvimarinus sp. DZF01 TaxID=3461371 RepID=UPI004045376B